MSTIINLTPHDITILASLGLEQGKDRKWVAKGETTTLVSLPSAGVARAEHQEESAGSVGEIPLVKTTFGEVEVTWKDGRKTTFPGFQDGVYYVVSLLTAQALSPERRAKGDLFGVGKTVSDQNGRIIGALCLNVV